MHITGCYDVLCSYNIIFTAQEWLNEEAEMCVSPESENASSFTQLHLLLLLFVLLLLFLSEVKGQNPLFVSSGTRCIAMIHCQVMIIGKSKEVLKFITQAVNLA